MAQKVTEIQILLSSPSNLVEERKIFADIISDVNHYVEKLFDIRIVPVTWENYCYSSSGEYVQDVVNNQLPICDYYVGLIGNKIGTKTLKAISGTVEEYEFYRSINKPILFYFKLIQSTQFDINLEEQAKINEFRARLSKDGVFFETYYEIHELRRKLCLSLYKHIIDYTIKNKLLSNKIDEHLYNYYAEEGIKYINLSNDVLFRSGSSMIKITTDSQKYIKGFNQSFKSNNLTVARANLNKFIDSYQVINSNLKIDNQLTEILFSSALENYSKALLGIKNSEEIIEIHDSSIKLKETFNTVINEISSTLATLEDTETIDKFINSNVFSNLKANVTISNEIFNNCLNYLNDFINLCVNLLSSKFSKQIYNIK